MNTVKPLPSLEATLSESTYSTFQSFMMEAVTATISDLKGEEALHLLTSFFSRTKHHGLSLFFSPTVTEWIVSDISSDRDVRSFVLSMYHRFVIAVSVAEMEDLFQATKDKLVNISAELHTEKCLLSKSLSYSESIKPDEMKEIVGANSWLVVLYLCLAFGTFEDALYEISEQAQKQAHK